MKADANGRAVLLRALHCDAVRTHPLLTGDRTAARMRNDHDHRIPTTTGGQNYNDTARDHYTGVRGVLPPSRGRLHHMRTVRGSHRNFAAKSRSECFPACAASAPRSAGERRPLTLRAGKGRVAFFDGGRPRLRGSNVEGDEDGP